MPKTPRDVSGREFAKLLNKKFDYKFERECGSHIRLASFCKGSEHKITIPDHAEIKIGTLNNILKDVSAYLGISKDQLLSQLFS
jgi:predicted RNA binding protein YcfA (HicA-like mRNA interferase family)